MGNCLVTKLKESVNNNLPVLGKFMLTLADNVSDDQSFGFKHLDGVERVPTINGVDATLTHAYDYMGISSYSANGNKGDVILIPEKYELNSIETLYVPINFDFTQLYFMDKLVRVDMKNVYNIGENTPIDMGRILTNNPNMIHFMFSDRSRGVNTAVDFDLSTMASLYELTVGGKYRWSKRMGMNNGIQFLFADFGDDLNNFIMSQYDYYSNHSGSIPDIEVTGTLAGTQEEADAIAFLKTKGIFLVNGQ